MPPEPPACAGWASGLITPQPGPAQVATAVRSTRLLGARPQLYSAAAVAGQRRSGRLCGKRLVGFGRATSDGFSRAVLWDIVVAGDLQGHGLGRRVIEELLHTQPVVGVERV